MKAFFNGASAALIAASFILIPTVSAADMVRKALRPAPGLKTVQSFSDKSLGTVVATIDAKQLSGVFNVDVSDADAILVEFGGNKVWFDTFDVLVFPPGKADKSDDCIEISKAAGSKQKSMGLGGC